MSSQAQSKKAINHRVSDYKGIHFKKEKSVPNYEFGAHFKYEELCSILSKLSQKENEEVGVQFSVPQEPATSNNNSTARLPNLSKVVKAKFFNNYNDSSQAQNNIKSIIFQSETSRKVDDIVNVANQEGKVKIGNLSMHILPSKQEATATDSKFIKLSKSIEPSKPVSLAATKSQIAENSISNKSKPKYNLNPELILPKIDTGIKNAPIKKGKHH